MLCKKRGSKGLFVSVTYFAVIVFSLISFVQTNSVENNRQDVDAVDKKDVRKQKGLEDLFRGSQPDFNANRFEDQRRIRQQQIRKRRRPVYLDPTKSRSNDNFHDIQVLNKGDNRGLLFDAKNILNDDFILFNDFTNEDVGNILLVGSKADEKKSVSKNRRNQKLLKDESDKSDPSDSEGLQSRELPERQKSARGLRYQQLQLQQQPLIKLNFNGRPQRNPGRFQNQRQQGLTGSRNRKQKQPYPDEELDDYRSPDYGNTYYGSDKPDEGKKFNDYDNFDGLPRNQKQKRYNNHEEQTRNSGDYSGDAERPGFSAHNIWNGNKNGGDYNREPDFQQQSGLRNQNRHNGIKYDEEPEIANHGFRSQNRPSSSPISLAPFNGPISGTNPDEVYYDEVFFDEDGPVGEGGVGEDFRDVSDADGPIPIENPGSEKFLPPKKYKIIPQLPRHRPNPSPVVGLVNIPRRAAVQRHLSGHRNPGLRHQQQHSRPGQRFRQQHGVLGLDGGDLASFQVDDDELQGFRPVRHTDGVHYENESANFGPFQDDPHESVNGQVGFYKKPAGFPTLQELSGGFSSKVEQKVEAPASVS